MAVAHDNSEESHTGTTGSASEASFSWTHTPVGTPRGVFVAVMTLADVDNISTVTYGGSALTQISEAVDTTTEPGRCTLFFLGSSVPTGAQTVQVNRTNNATVMYGISETVTASANTEVYTPGIVLLQNDGTLAEQNVDDGSPGTNSLRFGALYHGGGGSFPVVGANSTGLEAIIISAGTAAAAVRETTGGQGVRPVGWTAAASDDRAAIHFAVREIGGAPTPAPRGMLMGVG